MNKDKFRIESNLIDLKMREKMYKILFLKEGSVRIKIDFETSIQHAPSLIFISENQLLNIQKEPDHLEEIALSFSNDFFCIKLNRSETFCDAVIFNTTQPPYVSLNDTEAKKIEYLISSINNELKEANEYQEEIITSQLKTLLLYASKVKLKQFGAVHTATLSPVVNNFQNLLDEKYEKEHNVQFYADTLNISSKGLNKAVKKELGRTVSELIKEKLIIEAKRELYAKDLSVKEIAFQLGFDDPAYFSRFFKKETSHSPKEFSELQ